MEKHLSEMSLAELTAEEGIRCSCGKIHRCGLRFFRELVARCRVEDILDLPGAQ